MKDVVLIIGGPPGEEREETNEEFTARIRKEIGNVFGAIADQDKVLPVEDANKSTWHEVPLNIDVNPLDHGDLDVLHSFFEKQARQPGLADLLQGMAGAIEHEMMLSVVGSLKKENEELRALCDQYRSLIEKQRDKIVEQDKVIEKLVSGNSSGKTPMSC